MRSSFFGAFLLSAAAAVAETEEPEEPILDLSKDSAFHFEILVPLGLALYQGADIGPVLGAARDIIPGDFDSFSEEFYRLANETKAAAEDPNIAYSPVNVRDTWFSASTYFRRADFYLHGNWENHLINSLWDEQIAAFDKGMSSLPIPGERIRIPVDNFTVEGIWFKASEGECTKKPTLVICNGYDAAQEDLYHSVVVPALARGWNCLTFEGPGQPTVRRRSGIGFIPDWERVVNPIIDWLLEEQGDVVDTDRVALYGNSMAGYLAARAAAFEPRVSALLLNGGIFNLFDSFSSRIPPDILSLYKSGNKTGFDSAITSSLEDPSTPSNLRWGIEQGLWSFKTHSAFDFLERAKAFTLDDVIDKIKMPAWIAEAEFEAFFVNQSRLVKDALGDQATLHEFKGPAGYHTQVGAAVELCRVFFAWLEKTLG